MVYFLLLFYLSPSAFGQKPVGLPGIEQHHEEAASSSFSCPEEAYKVDFRSPVTGQRRMFCQKNTPSGLIKHGREVHFDENDKIILDIYFVNGKKAKAPKEVKASTNGHTDKITNAKVIFKQLLNAILPFASKKSNQKFKVYGCKANANKWFALLATGRSFTEVIKMNSICDVSGTFEAKKDEPFKVDLNLRNLKQYKKASMNIILSVHMREDYIFNIKASEGELLGPNENLEFTGSYSLSINPFKHPIIQSDNGGILNIHAINEKKVNFKEEIKLGH